MGAVVTEKFRRCDAVTKAWEGGYADHPDDPGGPTDRGVTQPTYDKFRRALGLQPRPVKGITAGEAEQLFYGQFWVEGQCERLAPGVDLATYDASVNSGLKRGRAWLLASVGGSDWETVKRICAKRLGFMQSLTIWKTFGKGWGRRVADIQAKGVAWALAAAHDPATVAAALEDEAAAKKKAANRQTSVGAATGTSGGGAIAIDQVPQGPPADAVPLPEAAGMADWLWLGLGGVLIAATLFLLWRANLNRQQAAAFKREAKVT